MRHISKIVAALATAVALSGCVVVPARPVAYHPIVIHPRVYAVY